MYIRVHLLDGNPTLLWYQVPDGWDAKKLINSIVRVPLRNKVVGAFVESVISEKPRVSFSIKFALDIEKFPCDTTYYPFIQKLAYLYQIPVFHLIKRLRSFLVQKEKKEKIEIQKESTEYVNTNYLTQEQKYVVDRIMPTLKSPSFDVHVVHGVTGSGKTEIYKACMKEIYGKKNTIVFLLPEVSLAIQFTHLLKQQLSDMQIFGFHSGTSIREKRDLWKRVCANDALVIVGVHLPILLPIANLGLIIIDEEHEIGYQEKKHPKINSKEAALLRAQLKNVPVILGSATPSMTTLYNTNIKKWHYYSLKQRFNGHFPQVDIVSLITQKRRLNFWISEPLRVAISTILARKEQGIIFLNRRGFSFFVQCRLCSFVFSCPSCSVSLTLHRDDQLRCHYCGIQRTLPTQCSQCSAEQKFFLKKGIGTQQVVSILRSMFPTARIERADLDATANKKRWQGVFHSFQKGELDILVGTQMITKGYHFPNVTLVGVLWADLNLHFPVYNATESSLQQLIQVAGRAGRAREHSRVIVQAIMEHPVFSYLNEQRYLQFFTRELKNRKEAGYPPFVRLASIELKHADENTVDAESHNFSEQLKKKQCKQNGVTILGPAVPAVHKIKGISSRKIYIKGDNIDVLIALYASIEQKTYKSSIFFTPNPLT